jgi:hypothetical protein
MNRNAVMRFNLPRWHGIFFLILAGLVLPSITRSEEAHPDLPDMPTRLSDIVRTLCARLQIADYVEVHVDDNNSRMVSSEPLTGSVRGYRISFDRQFLESLNDDEVTGAIAHELGHVWIFSHHPYLQTEQLANEIAMRVVSRETMKQIYAKLWTHTGVAGNLDQLLGPEPAVHSITVLVQP